MDSGDRAGVVSLAPLGVLLISVLACKVLSRVSVASNWWLVGFGTLGYLAVMAVLGVVLASQARASLVSTLIPAALVVAAGLMWGNASKPEANLFGRLAEPTRTTTPELAAAGRGAGLALTVMTAAAAALVLAWSIGGRQDFGTILEAYQIDALGGAILVLLSLALVPNLLAYSLAYLAGPGFQVGTDTAFSVGTTQGGPTPALPILGLLPQSDPPPATRLLVLIPVAAGLLAGWMIHRWLAGRWWREGLAALAAAGLGGGAVGVVVVLASGALGPGRMSQVGASGMTVGLVVGLELAIGALLGSLILPRLGKMLGFGRAREPATSAVAELEAV